MIISIKKSTTFRLFPDIYTVEISLGTDDYRRGGEISPSLDGITNQTSKSQENVPESYEYLIRRWFKSNPKTNLINFN